MKSAFLLVAALSVPAAHAQMRDNRDKEMTPLYAKLPAWLWHRSGRSYVALHYALCPSVGSQ